MCVPNIGAAAATARRCGSKSTTAAAGSGGIGKKKPKSAYNHEETKRALTFFMENKSASGNDAADKFQEASKPTVQRKIKLLGLRKLRDEGNVDEGLSRINSMEQTLGYDKSRVSERRWFTEEEEEVLVSKIEMVGKMGFPFRRDTLAEEMYSFLVANYGTDSIDPLTGKKRSYSEKAADSFLRRHKDRIGSYMSSNIGEDRADKANMETMKVWLDKLVSYCEDMGRDGVFPAEWHGYKDIPGSNMYNMDEMSKDTTKNRRKILGGKQQKKGNRFGSRFFESTDGDHQGFHASFGVTSRGDGIYCIPYLDQEGAPPPFLIFSALSASKSGKYKVTSNHLKNIRVVKRNGKRIEMLNPYGFLVSVSRNGSMTMELFEVWAKHFVKYLPKGQGKNGEPVLLFFDGHSSRWSISAILFLRENNVHCFCLPSHTSIWAQPNDAGINRAINIIFGTAFSAWKNEPANRLVKLTIPDFNSVAISTWGSYLIEEATLLAQTKANHSTDAYKVVGIKPFDPYPAAWVAAIETLGGEGLAGSSSEERTFYCIGERKEPSPTDEQKTILLANEALAEGGKHLRTDWARLVFSARAIGRQLLAKWRQEGGSKLHLPLPSTELEKAAFSVIEYQNYDSIMAAEVSEEEIAKNRLSALQRGEQFDFATESGVTGSAMKLAGSPRFFFSHDGSATNNDGVVALDAVLIRLSSKALSIKFKEPTCTDDNRRALDLVKERQERQKNAMAKQAAMAKGTAEKDAKLELWRKKCEDGIASAEFNNLVKDLAVPYLSKHDGFYVDVPWDGKPPKAVGDRFLEAAAADIVKKNRSARKQARRDDARDAAGGPTAKRSKKIPNVGVSSDRGLDPVEAHDAIEAKYAAIAKKKSAKERKTLNNKLKLIKSRLAKAKQVKSKLECDAEPDDISLTLIAFALKEFEVPGTPKKVTKDTRTQVNILFKENVRLLLVTDRIRRMEREQLDIVAELAAVEEDDDAIVEEVAGAVVAEPNDEDEYESDDSNFGAIDFNQAGFAMDVDDGDSDSNEELVCDDAMEVEEDY